MQITVQDHGIGISAEAVPHLFERGYRAPEAVGTAPGLGLGLNISAKIVKRHGGVIEVRRGKPLGSIMTVRLPLSQTTMPMAHTAGRHVGQTQTNESESKMAVSTIRR